ncbi:hypothetical protein OUQ49_33215 (plasmid) [Streptomyces cavourensis]|uniref:hypothetical protein n=1 Tax=Streptomyces cavourensis TaxID=67258 RepID=UPI002279DA47|nr:hypothetical protein [Streptomyces cavourensis]WAE70681.1 hypothetical protein OUQ49_33215 [Streptomyces cavourensis]
MQPNDHAPRTDRQELPNLPVPLPKTPPKKQPFAALRAWWDKAWEDDGVLNLMWMDILNVPQDGPRNMAPWIRAVVMLVGASFVVLAVLAAGEAVLRTVHQLLTVVPTVQVGVDTSDSVLAIVDLPVRAYIAQHSAGLPIAASTVYTLWLATGIAALILGYFTRSNALRAMWTGWGAATVFMVWAATPDTSRTVAVALTVLAWTLLSALALNGLSLRRTVGRPAHPAKTPARPDVHIHMPPAADRHSNCPFRD